MEFVVWTGCKEGCHDFRPSRIVFISMDPIKAIEQATSLRDLNHESWIQTVTLKEVN